MTVHHQPIETKEGTVTRPFVWKLMILLAATFAIPADAQLNNEFTAQGGAWRLYKKNCSGCHGFRGQGIPPMGTELVGNAFVTGSRAEAVKQVIRNGRKDKEKTRPQYGLDPNGYMSMPPFPSVVINDGELELLVGYLKGAFQNRQFN